MSIKLLKSTSLGLLLAIAACGDQASEDAAPPPAKTLTADAIGHFCGMLVVNHEGPKGQVIIKGQAEPLWFVSVRDAIAYSRLPDEAWKVEAVYVSDIGSADSWANPGTDNWIPIEEAYLVVDSASIAAAPPQAISFRTCRRAFMGLVMCTMIHLF